MASQQDCWIGPRIRVWPLFFAVENARDERGISPPDAAIWVLDPLLLNTTALANHAADRVLSIEDELLHAYLPKTPFKHSAKLPVVVGGVHNSRRIVAQRGSFVLFGANVHAMNADPGLAAVPNLIRKLIIPGASKAAFREALFVKGVSDSLVYPDLGGLSREIRFQEGF